MRTKCADALDKLPQDIFVPSPMDIDAWCPYIHPRSNELKVGNPNNFIESLNHLQLLLAIQTFLQSKCPSKICTEFWRAGFAMAKRFFRAISTS